MIRRHPGSTRPDTFFPYTTRFRSVAGPVAGLSLSLNGSFNRAKVTDLTDSEAAISGAELGTRLASPHFQGSGTLRYDFPIGADDTAYAAVNVSHAGSFPNQFPNVPGNPDAAAPTYDRSEEHTSELQSLMRTSYAVFCLKKKKKKNQNNKHTI